MHEHQPAVADHRDHAPYRQSRWSIHLGADRWSLGRRWGRQLQNRRFRSEKSGKLSSQRKS